MMSDNSSKYCLRCLDTFTFNNRRHHCRNCGVLCCDLCSAKRLNPNPLPPTPGSGGGENPSLRKGSSAGSTTPPPVSRKGAASDGERICDSCYNKMTSQCAEYTQAMWRAKRDKERAEAARAKEDEQSNKAALTKESNRGKSSQQDGAASATSAAEASANDTMNELRKQVEKVAELADKSAVMLEVF